MSKKPQAPINKEARKVKEELILKLGAPTLAKALEALMKNTSRLDEFRQGAKNGSVTRQNPAKNSGVNKPKPATKPAKKESFFKRLFK